MSLGGQYTLRFQKGSYGSLLIWFMVKILILTTCHSIRNLSSGGMLVKINNIKSNFKILILTTCHSIWNLSPGGMLSKIKKY